MSKRICSVYIHRQKKKIHSIHRVQTPTGALESIPCREGTTVIWKVFRSFYRVSGCNEQIIRKHAIGISVSSGNIMLLQLWNGTEKPDGEYGWDSRIVYSSKRDQFNSARKENSTGGEKTKYAHRTTQCTSSLGSLNGLGKTLKDLEELKSTFC